MGGGLQSRYPFYTGIPFTSTLAKSEDQGYAALHQCLHSCADAEGGGGTGGPDPPEKSQKYRVF